MSFDYAGYAETLTQQVRLLRFTDEPFTSESGKGHAFSLVSEDPATREKRTIVTLRATVSEPVQGVSQPMKLALSSSVPEISDHLLRVRYDHDLSDNFHATTRRGLDMRIADEFLRKVARFALAIGHRTFDEPLRGDIRVAHANGITTQAYIGKLSCFSNVTTKPGFAMYTYGLSDNNSTALDLVINGRDANFVVTAADGNINHAVTDRMNHENEGLLQSIADLFREAPESFARGPAGEVRQMMADKILPTYGNVILGFGRNPIHEMPGAEFG
jgi:hypothetical protein